MKSRLFWKVAFPYLLMLLLVLAALDIYVVRTLRIEHLESAFSQLESLSRLAFANPPKSWNETELREWVQWFGQSGIRLTLIDEDGKVLADSSEDPAKMENHRARPEIKEAMANGSGRAVRRSPTLGLDLVYLAKRYKAESGRPLIIRLSLPVYRLNEALAAFRSRLWSISLIILILAGGISLLFFRSVSNRIRRLTEFSRRVAEGDFRLLAPERNSDELTDLSTTLNQTASKLDRTIKSLTEERNQSAAVLASMEEGVAVIGRDQRVYRAKAALSLN
jgi:two-component system phosphate regulon sensor histidine kinase PhoR